MEKIEQQGLKNKKIPLEYSPVVFNESLDDYTNDFQYGATIQQLRPGIEVVESTSSSVPFIGYFTITTTGSKVITGVGFTSSIVEFTYTDQAGGSGSGAMTALSQFGHDIVSGSSLQTDCIYLRDAGSTTVCRAEKTSIDSDGFTLNVTTNSGTNRIDFIARP